MTIDAPVGTDPAQFLTLLPQIVNQANTDIGGVQADADAAATAAAAAQSTADAAPTLAASREVSTTKAVRADDPRLQVLLPVQLADGTDLDTLVNASAVYALSANTYAHAPISGASGIIETKYLFANSGLQVWRSVGGGSEVFTRFRGSTGYGPWVRVDAAAAIAYTDKVAGRTALASWRDGRDAAAATAANIVCFGDSRTEGTGTSDVSRRWQTLLQGHLRRQYGLLSGTTFPFIPTYPQTGAPGFPVTRSGNVTQDTTYGLGWRTGRLRDDTASVTFTFTGTSAALMYVRGSTTGIMRISVDGGAATVVDTNSSAGGASNAALWSTGTLARATHTITVTRDPATPNSVWHIFLQGALTWDGDETAGIRVIDAGYHGSASTFFTSTRNSTGAAAVNALGEVPLVVIAMGTNDTIGPTSPATYRSNLEGLITALRTSGGFSGSVLLLNMVKPNTVTAAVYAPFAEQMAAIARDDDKVEFYDLRREQPDVPTPYDAIAGQGLFNDNIHEGDYGHALIAGKLARLLGA